MPDSTTNTPPKTTPVACSRRTMSEMGIGGGRLPAPPPLDLASWYPKYMPDTTDTVLVDTLGQKYRVHSFLLHLYSQVWRDGLASKPALQRMSSPSSKEQPLSRGSLSSSMTTDLPTYEVGVVSSTLSTFCEFLYFTGSKDMSDLLSECNVADLWMLFARYGMDWAQICVRFLEKRLCELADMVEVKSPEIELREPLEEDRVEEVLKALETCHWVKGPASISQACIRILVLNSLTETQFTRLDAQTKFIIAESRLARFHRSEQMLLQQRNNIHVCGNLRKHVFVLNRCWYL